MLGILRTAMPSKDMPLRSSDLPQHWWKQNNRWFSIHTTERKQAIKAKCKLVLNLDRETLRQLLAGGGDGLRSGKFKIPKFVLHS